MAKRIGYVGTIHSRREVRVLALTSGTVLSLTDEGETVRLGEIVARIVAPEADARVARLDAEVERARTERDFLCNNHETDLTLHAAGVISRTQVDSSKRACDSANAAVAAARAGSREVAASKQRTSEAAPFDGVVLKWLVEPGQNVMPGTPLLLLGSDDLEVRVPVAERDLDRGVREGISSIVRMRGREMRLPVSSVAPMAAGPGRASELRIALPEDPALYPPHGASARVDFLVAEAAGAFVVPERALTVEEGASFIYIVEKGTAHRTAVVPGIRDGNYVEVTGDLAAESLVAVSNLDLLGDGLSVFAVHSESRTGERP